MCPAHVGGYVAAQAQGTYQTPLCRADCGRPGAKNTPDDIGVRPDARRKVSAACCATMHRSARTAARGGAPGTAVPEAFVTNREPPGDTRPRSVVVVRSPKAGRGARGGAAMAALRAHGVEIAEVM